MSEEFASEALVDQLRNNLRAAGIIITEADIQGMRDKGFLKTAAAFYELIERTPSDLLPDYLRGWSPAEAAPPANSSAAQTASQFAGAQDVPTDLTYATIGQISRLIQTRQISPLELTEQVLARIPERDQQLNSFQVLTADYAREAARTAEREIAAGEYRGVLHGVPLAIKDLLAMRDTVTTAGSKILGGWRTDFNSTAVDKLEAAGAIIVGKTRLSEFAYSPGSNNAHYGATANPWNLAHDTGGSSSGSGAAVAGGLVYGALGSDTGGSIRIPAAQCGIVGLKPTFGRVSLHGGVTLSWSLDHLGPMTRTVDDAALLLAALSGYDTNDIRTRPGTEWQIPADLAQGVKGLRIGVLGKDGSNETATPAALAAWRDGLQRLANNGAELIELDLPEINDARALNGAILAMEAGAFHHPNLQKRLDDYGEFMRHRILNSYVYGAGAFVRAQQARNTLRQKLNAIFNQVDLLSTPTMLAVAPPLGVPGTTFFTGPFNLLGWPAISVPVALSEGLPLGLQLVGKPWDEATVLRAARVLEAETKWQNPAF